MINFVLFVLALTLSVAGSAGNTITSNVSHVVGSSRDPSLSGFQYSATIIDSATVLGFMSFACPDWDGLCVDACLDAQESTCLPLRKLQLDEFSSIVSLKVASHVSSEASVGVTLAKFSETVSADDVGLQNSVILMCDVVFRDGDGDLDKTNFADIILDEFNVAAIEQFQSFVVRLDLSDVRRIRIAHIFVRNGELKIIVNEPEPAEEMLVRDWSLGGFFSNVSRVAASANSESKSKTDMLVAVQEWQSLRTVETFWFDVTHSDDDDDPDDAMNMLASVVTETDVVGFSISRSEGCSGILVVLQDSGQLTTLTSDLRLVDDDDDSVWKVVSSQLAKEIPSDVLQGEFEIHNKFIALPKSGIHAFAFVWFGRGVFIMLVEEPSGATQMTLWQELPDFEAPLPNALSLTSSVDFAVVNTLEIGVVISLAQGDGSTEYWSFSFTYESPTQKETGSWSRQCAADDDDDGQVYRDPFDEKGAPPVKIPRIRFPTTTTGPSTTESATTVDGVASDVLSSPSSMDKMLIPIHPDIVKFIEDNLIAAIAVAIVLACCLMLCCVICLRWICRRRRYRSSSIHGKSKKRPSRNKKTKTKSKPISPRHSRTYHKSSRRGSASYVMNVKHNNNRRSSSHKDLAPSPPVLFPAPVTPEDHIYENVPDIVPLEPTYDVVNVAADVKNSEPTYSNVELIRNNDTDNDTEEIVYDAFNAPL